MKTLLNNKGYGILRSELNSLQEQYIKEMLTVRPTVLSDYDFGTTESYPVYRFNSTKYYVPKFWGIQTFGAPCYNEEKENVDKAPNYEFVGKLKDYQIDFTQKILDELRKNSSCIATSGTGSGKTTMALWIASNLKKKTLIVVHKEFLMDQWIARIKQFLPTSSVGIIRQNTYDVSKDIVVGMIQSITQHTYPKGTFDSFDFCIIDEVHHLSSRTFSELPYIAETKYKLGLTATLKRTDGLTKVIEWFLGATIVNTSESDVDSPIVKFVKAEYSSILKPKYNWKKKLITANMETQIADDKGRTKQVLKEIVELAGLGRKILVLSSRRKHCEELKELFDLTVLTEVGKFSSGLYLGGMTEPQLQKSNTCDVIFATYNMAHEGYDNPGLDTLVMATGKGDIEQACGRILRKRNKFRPMIIDFTDIGYFKGQYNRRKAFYKKKGYTIFDDDNNDDAKTEDSDNYEDSLF